jgi:hypothetical protein
MEHKNNPWGLHNIYGWQGTTLGEHKNQLYNEIETLVSDGVR